MEGIMLDSPAPDGTTALAIALGHMHEAMVRALYKRPLLSLTQSSTSIAEEVLGQPKRLCQFDPSGHAGDYVNR